MADAVGSSSNVWARFREWIKVRAVIFVAVLLALPVYFAWRAVTALPPGMAWDRDGIAVDLKTMADWEMDPLLATDESVPKWIRELNGKRVVFVGEIAPATLESDSDGVRFDLVYTTRMSSKREPKIQQFVKCRADAARRSEIKLSAGIARVVGKLEVGIERDPHHPSYISSVYRLDVESVNPS